MSKRKTLRKAFSTVSKRVWSVNQPLSSIPLDDFCSALCECSTRNYRTHAPQGHIWLVHSHDHIELKSVRVSYPTTGYTPIKSSWGKWWKNKNPSFEGFKRLLERKAEVPIEPFCLFFVLGRGYHGDGKPKHIAEVFVRSFREDGVFFNADGHISHIINRWWF